MKYHVSETPLRLREYGRNVQSMVEYLQTLEDKDVRTAVAHEIIRYMVCLKPAIKENPEYKQKLWDYLFLIAEGDLDVDAPYEVPDVTPAHHPSGVRMPYPRRKPRLKAFGINIELMIENALEMEHGPTRDAYLNTIANAVKMLTPALDKGVSVEDVVVEQISRISKGKLIIDPATIRLSKVVPTHPHQQPQRPIKKGGGSNRKKTRSRGGKRR